MSKNKHSKCFECFLTHLLGKAGSHSHFKNRHEKGNKQTWTRGLRWVPYSKERCERDMNDRGGPCLCEQCSHTLYIMSQASNNIVSNNKGMEANDIDTGGALVGNSILSPSPSQGNTTTGISSWFSFHNAVVVILDSDTHKLT
jgi:hypothetical protein